MKVTLKKWEKGNLRRIYISGTSLDGAFIASASRRDDDVWVVRPRRDFGEVSRSTLDSIADEIGDALRASGLDCPAFFDKFWAVLPNRLEIPNRLEAEI